MSILAHNINEQDGILWHGLDTYYEVKPIRMSELEMRIQILPFFFLFVFSTNLNAYEKPRAPENVSGSTIVSAEEVVKMILANPELIVIDSRKRTEYINGHIEGAVNILNTEMTPEDLKAIVPDKSTALLFYCNGVKCIRSSDAVNKAIDWGYTNVYWFRNGWKSWKEKKLPMVID